MLAVLRLAQADEMILADHTLLLAILAGTVHGPFDARTLFPVTDVSVTLAASLIKLRLTCTLEMSL